MRRIQIQNPCIKASSSEELLGIKIDINLIFHDQITSLCANLIKTLVLYQVCIKEHEHKQKTHINEILYFS